MLIPKSDYDKVRDINVSKGAVSCQYDYWYNRFINDEYITNQLKLIRKRMGDSFGRSDLIKFYQLTDVDLATKFIACMIWGHESPNPRKRDARGPWKLERMFENNLEAISLIHNIVISTDEEIVRSYKSLNRSLPQCGPSFFTKHFYFLGKSEGLDNYPLIFDDRVAGGVCKILSRTSRNINIFDVRSSKNANAYLRYLEIVRNEVDIIGCEADQVEYYLFEVDKVRQQSDL
ncbi:MAG: hypothetical protein LAT56_14355 [Wenzhouxiangella sp.]|nr:hypothetical protein [Wenzhouxiangella sp.]